MSDSNKRDEGMKDYMDLLEEMSRKDSENAEKMPSPPPIKDTQTEKTEFEDIKSSSDKEKNPFKRLSRWYNNLPKKKKIVVSIVAVFLAFVIVITTALGIFIGKKFGLLGDNINGLEYDDTIYDDGEFDDINIDIGSAGFKQALQDWATQGNDNKMSSRNVINVLLVGADSRKGTNSGNTDVMMLVSLNKKTKELKLVSFLRDSYLYIEGKNNSYCTKLNAAFSMGGPECLLQTIENNYKIEIDNYVMVNFESFKSIIDAMGGVTVDVQKYEADYNYTKFKISLPYGENVTLNGEQALCFCRIRGCDADGDVSRTRRQRQVIEAIIDRVTSASVSDLNKYIDILLPYVETGYSKTQIISLGVQALTGKWYGYERTQLQMPDEECRTSGSANAWIWVVDYQLAAHKLQTELYGQSNITLPEDRVSIIDIYRGANYSGSSSSGNSNTVTTAKDDKNNIPSTTVGTTAPETTQSDTTKPDDNNQNVETTAEVTENTTVSSVTEIPETTGAETTTASAPPTTQSNLPLPEVTDNG